MALGFNFGEEVICCCISVCYVDLGLDWWIILWVRVLSAGFAGRATREEWHSHARRAVEKIHFRASGGVP